MRFLLIPLQVKDNLHINRISQLFGSSTSSLQSSSTVTCGLVRYLTTGRESPLLYLPCTRSMASTTSSLDTVIRFFPFSSLLKSFSDSGTSAYIIVPNLATVLSK